MSKKVDFSGYISGNKLLENTDKYIIKRAVLLKKQLKEDKKGIGNVKTKNLLKYK
ncbi:hypothetical protein M0P65_04255 [Candidatus Gracilibacteria bacterium]|nr:hypothetical protein [Candidatus Gracilibacteria bacterium]